MLATANTNPVAVVPTQPTMGSSPMDELLAHLAEQEVVSSKQRLEHQQLNAQHHAEGSRSSSHSGSEQPNTDSYAITPRTGSQEPSASPKTVLRLQQELDMAQNQIAHMNQELNQSRITKHTMEQAMGSQFDADFDHTREFGSRPHSRVDGWVQSTRPGPPPTTTGPSAGNGIWNSGPSFALNDAGVIGQGGSMPLNNGWSNNEPRSFTNGRMDGNFLPMGLNPRQQMPSLRLDTAGLGPFFGNDPSPNDYSMRSTGQPSRPASAFGNNLEPWGSFSTNANGSDQMGITPPMTPMPFGPIQAGMGGMPHMQPIHPMQHMQTLQNPNMMQGNMNQCIPRPIGTRLSPTAMEFHGSGGFPGNTPWNMQPQARPNSRISRCSTPTDNSQGAPETPASYLSTAEPMNYRRLLDRNMSCNWKYIVDKIVHSNDQQASIFLQQKLKVGTSDQKFEIVQAIIDQAYALMINRFGNFLVQRCFEHGSPEQVIAIARAIRGNTLNLSMDAFGCHVVQKAFDCVPEEFKAIMVHELLRRIPETVIHRYACHVWQKLFELRWSDSPPQIMKYVNEALRGMWHEVALGETGSLVVQNIFENCLEEDKRPCINEVLASIDVVAHGQFGNWCIQHICEHGSPPDRTRAIDHVLRFATEYSMDQFASKVVEKCLKIGGVVFLDRYLDRVCEGRADRPRMPLIDSKFCHRVRLERLLTACHSFGRSIWQLPGSVHSHPRRSSAP